MKKLILIATLVFLSLAAISQTGNVGIGTSNPLARLHVADSSVLFTGPVFVNQLAFPPVNGIGGRMMWFPPRLAFRVGYTNNTEWDRDSIGVGSVAMGLSTKAKGGGSVALGGSTQALGDFSSAFNSNTFAIGPNSSSFGFFSRALGRNSFAAGFSSIAGNENSISLGDGNQALGYSSVSMITGNVSRGNYSFTSGLFNIAKARGGFVLGAYNDTTDSPTSTDDPADRIFQIGNGLSENQRSNAVTVLRNGNIGVGINNPIARIDTKDRILVRGGGNLFSSPGVLFTGVTTPSVISMTGMRNDSLIGFYGAPLTVNSGWGLSMNVFNGRIGIGTDYAKAALHVVDSAVVFSSNFIPNINLPIPPPVEGSGTRMFWFPQKAAFRAGFVTAGFWDRINIGVGSFAAGINTLASGDGSVALGTGARALNNGALVFGVLGTAWAESSVAIGAEATANASFSVAIGSGAFTNAPGSIATGQFNDITDVPTGGVTDRLFQIGNGDGFVRSNALTMLRNAFTGIGNIDPAYILDLSGRMRIRSGGDLNSSAGIWLNNTTNTDQISFIGNQTDNAVGLFGNSGAGWGLVMNTTSGNVGIGVLNPAHKLHVGGNIVATGTITPSDMRFKKNINPIAHALDRLIQVRGVNYWMKSAEFPQMKFDSSLQYGVIAQELEKVFPEMVFTIDKDGYKGVDYIKLVPVLIEAIKELKEENNQLNKKQAEQEKLIANILRRIESLEKKD